MARNSSSALATYLFILAFIVIAAFLWLLVQHPFDPAHIIMDIDDEEAIIIVHENTTDHLHASRDIAQHDVHEDQSPPLSPNQIILGNPLQSKQCQNALIEREHISKREFLATYYNATLFKKCKPQRIWDSDGVWTREYLDAISTQNCFVPRLMLRTALNNYYANTTAPVFYHIPKSASSSTASMTKEYWGFGSRWRTRYDIVHEPYNHTLCGFTFVRDPVKRLISGYYTVNAMIFGENDLSFLHHNNSKYERYKFIKTFGEPARFETFLDEMREHPSWFYGNVPLRHCASQIYFLSTFYGSNIHWVGRVEHYNEHWIALLNHGECGKYFRNESNILPGKKALIERPITGMYHYGFDRQFYLRPDKKQKYQEYVDAMSLQETFEDGKTLPPVYHRMTERIYNKIVDYFWADFVCLGYSYDFQQFVADVQAKEQKRAVPR